ncbi:replication factor c subunit 3 [Stemphylium lycopersici]|nr:replication factor c subunit 3 [Stemphylium lycopersici]
MSDIEDEMDVDAPAVDNSISFGGDQKKGKRSAANLPVEAEDSLPWVEKYRPNSLDDVEGHKDIIATINKFVDSNRLPHLLLYGPPGTGKTSTVLALARRIYGSKNMRQMVLELNASDDRGIDVVREQIKTFSSTKQIFAAAPKPGDSSLATFKLIILDEADAMTATAQMALRRIMEKYTANTRFCIIANYTHKLSPALLSRCTRFRFSPLKNRDIRNLVDRVIEEEKVNITQDATDSLVVLSKGDMRRSLNVLQACHASSTPLQPSGKPPVDPSSIVRDQITQTTIYDCIAAPHPSDIKYIIETLLSKNDMTECLRTINNLKTMKGLALADILTAIGEELVTNDVPSQVMVTWMSGLADIEYRLSGGGSETIQTDIPQTPHQQTTLDSTTDISLNWKRSIVSLLPRAHQNHFSATFQHHYIRAFQHACCSEEKQRGDGPFRRRLSTRPSFDPLPVPVSKEAAKLQERRATIGKPRRPTRWRGPKRNDDAFQAAWAKNMAPAVQSQTAKRPTQKQEQKQDKSASKPQNIELRFSFSAAPEEEPPSRRGRDETITQSFSGLSMSNSAATRSVSANPSQTKTQTFQEPRRHSESISQAPQLAKPRKKREGYGFSYSETFMYDSDDYPDTECEWEASEESQSPRPQAGSSSPSNPYLNWDGTERQDASSRPTSRDSTTTVEDTSFNDLVVLRDVGSFHLARPQRILPCTRATREDTLRLKLRAKSLIDKFEESSEIQAQLLTRLERMMYALQQQQKHPQQQQQQHLHPNQHLQKQHGQQDEKESNPLAACATKLHAFLLRIQQDRIDTGEHATIVQHEIEWVEWLVEASRTGVMHVRGVGCVCRPDWDPE